MNILKLLESLALFECMDADDFDAVQCVKCGELVVLDDDIELTHKPDCQLKAAIDALKSGRLVVVDAETAKLGKWAKNTLPVATPFKKEQGE